MYVQALDGINHLTKGVKELSGLHLEIQFSYYFLISRQYDASKKFLSYIGIV